VNETLTLLVNSFTNSLTLVSFKLLVKSFVISVSQNLLSHLKEHIVSLKLALHRRAFRNFANNYGLKPVSQFLQHDLFGERSTHESLSVTYAFA